MSFSVFLVVLHIQTHNPSHISSSTNLFMHFLWFLFKWVVCSKLVVFSYTALFAKKQCPFSYFWLFSISKQTIEVIFHFQPNYYYSHAITTLIFISMSLRIFSRFLSFLRNLSFLFAHQTVSFSYFWSFCVFKHIIQVVFRFQPNYNYSHSITIQIFISLSFIHFLSFLCFCRLHWMPFFGYVVPFFSLS